MSAGNIKMTVLDGLTADDVLKLKTGGFFDGVAVTLPPGVTGQQATLRIPVRDDAKVAQALKPVEEVILTPTTVQTTMPNTADNVLHALAFPDNLEKAAAKAAKAAPSVETGASGARTGVEAAQKPNQIDSQDGVRSAPITQPSAPAPASPSASDLPLKPAPTGNGKRLPAKHAIAGGEYVVKAFGVSWYATAMGATKAGPKFKLNNKAEPNEIYTTEDVLVEEVSVENADQDAIDTAPDSDLSVETLLTFTKLRDLLQYVIQCGIPAAGASDFCESMKAEVPLLQRISNIGDRVQRTLEVMGAV